MTEEVRTIILKWIFDNHEHHEIVSADEPNCEDGNAPYVNSLALEAFIKGLRR